MSQSQLEQRIERIEARLAEIDGELASPEIHRDGARIKQLRAERDALAAELQPLENEWAARAEVSH